MPTTKKRPEPMPQARKSALDSDYAPLYAVAGLTDVLAASVKHTIEQTQERAVKGVSVLRSRPAQLERQAKANADELGRLLKSFPEQVKSLPETTSTRIAEMQRLLQAYLDEASETYADLAGRGKRAVDETIVTAKTLSGIAERKAEDVRADLAEAVDPAFERVQETVTVARKTVTGRTATPTVTSRSAARAAAARVAAAEREAAEQEASKRVSAERAKVRRAAAERDAAERTAEERVAAEKAAARKAAAKRGAATRAAAKKAAAEQAAAVKAAEEKAAKKQAAAVKAAEARATSKAQEQSDDKS